MIEEADPPDPIVFGEFPVQLFWPVLYAIEAGRFENRELSENPIFGGSRNIASLVSGDIDMLPGPINLAREQNTYLKSIYQITVGHEDAPSGTYLIAHEDGTDYSDIECGTIATLAGDPGITVASIRRLLENACLDPFDVEWTKQPGPEIIGSVARHEVVGGSGFEPSISAAIQNEDLPIQKFDPMYGFSEPVGVAGPWTTAEFAEDHPATLELFQRACRPQSKTYGPIQVGSRPSSVSNSSSTRTSSSTWWSRVIWGRFRVR